MNQIICPECKSAISEQDVHLCPSCNYDIHKYLTDLNTDLALSEIDRISISDAQKHKNLKQSYNFLKKDIYMINEMNLPDKPRYIQTYKNVETARMALEYLALSMLGFMLCFLSTIFYPIEASVVIFYPVYIVIVNYRKYKMLKIQYQEALTDWNGYKQKLILDRIHQYSEKGYVTNK